VDAFIVQALGTVPRRIKLWRGGLTKNGLSQQERATLLLPCWRVSWRSSVFQRQEYYVIPALPAWRCYWEDGWRENRFPLDEKGAGRQRKDFIAGIAGDRRGCLRRVVILAVQSKTPPQL